MPVLKSRYSHVKIWRPNGTKYANHTVTTANVRDTAAAAAIGVAICLEKFQEEFGYKPREDETVVEVVGVTGAVSVSLSEIKE